MQRASPRPPTPQIVKKVAVQPNNASELDDLEESITAATIPKQPVAEETQTYQVQTPLRQNNQVGGQMNFTQTHAIYSRQGQSYESPQSQQMQPMTVQSRMTQQMMIDQNSSEEDQQVVTLQNGARITLAEFKRLQQQQQLRDPARQTLVKSKEQPRPVQRVPPMQTQPQHLQSPQGSSASSENHEAAISVGEQASEPQSAKMLIFLQNGEQRLITFTLPKESCTLQEVLEQVNVPFSEDTNIQCMQNTSSEIDYFVSIGSNTRIEDMLENHPILVGDLNSRKSPSSSSIQQSSEVSTPDKSQCPDNVSDSPDSPRPRTPPPRYVDGMLALCKTCGYTGFDFSRCQRCKRIFTEEPKSVPIASKKVDLKKKDCERPQTSLEKTITCGDGIKINLLRTPAKGINNKTPNSTEKKPIRYRKPKGKQPDPEPVILTLSSDEEDSNSSSMSHHQEQSALSKEPTLSEIEGDPDSGLGMDTMDGKEVQKRWRSIRDSFTKAYRQGKCVHAEQCSTGSRRSFHNKQMSFLLKALQNNRKLRYSIDKYDSLSDASNSPQHIPTEDFSDRSKLDASDKPLDLKKQTSDSGKTSDTQNQEKTSEFENQEKTALDILAVINSVAAQDAKKQVETKADTNMNSSILPEDHFDDDKMFLNSLIPSFKKMNDDTRLLCRIEVLKIIRYALQGDVVFESLKLSEDHFYKSRFEHGMPRPVKDEFSPGDSGRANDSLSIVTRSADGSRPGRKRRIKSPSPHPAVPIKKRGPGRPRKIRPPSSDSDTAAEEAKRRGPKKHIPQESPGIKPVPYSEPRLTELEQKLSTATSIAQLATPEFMQIYNLERTKTIPEMVFTPTSTITPDIQVSVKQEPLDIEHHLH